MPVASCTKLLGRMLPEPLVQLKDPKWEVVFWNDHSHRSLRGAAAAAARQGGPQQCGQPGGAGREHFWHHRLQAGITTGQAARGAATHLPSSCMITKACASLLLSVSLATPASGVRPLAVMSQA